MIIDVNRSRKVCFINFDDPLSGLTQLIRYPAGELQVRLTPQGVREVRQADSITVKASRLQEPDQLLQFIQFADALAAVGASNWQENKLILPYLPYARADRRFVEGDCHGLAVFAQLLRPTPFSTIETLDVHSDKAGQHIHALRNLSPIKYIQMAIRALAADTSILLPDKGAERYILDGSLAEIVGEARILRGEKQRDPLTGALSGFKVPKVETPRVLIVDDICDGGGTFSGIAQAIHKEQPEVRVLLYVTHGIFSKGLAPLVSPILDINRIEHIFTTDTLSPSTRIRAANQEKLIDKLSVFAVDWKA